MRGCGRAGVRKSWEEVNQHVENGPGKDIICTAWSSSWEISVMRLESSLFIIFSFSSPRESWTGHR